MRIRLQSLLVADQAAALAFYTDVLGFVKKHDVPAGPYRWITVVSPDGPDELELVLEPAANADAKAYQEAMQAQGIPLAAFETNDLEADVERLRAKDVRFTQDVTRMGPMSLAVFDDGCGNLIQLYEPDPDA